MPMLKIIGLAVVIVVGLSSMALAQSRPTHSSASLRALCDRALAARGMAHASSAVRQRCVAILRARLAGSQARLRRGVCYYMIDPNQRGWSMDSHDFTRMHGQGIKPCPGM
jgi:hypothetical protein